MPTQPNSLLPLIRQARKLDAERKFTEALAIYDKLIAEYPQDDDLFMKAGATAYNSGDMQRAFEYFKSAQKINPRNAGAYSNLGVLLKMAKKYKDAIACFTQSLQISPDAGTYMNLGNLYRDQYATSKANACYIKGLEIDNRNAELMNNFGLCLINQGDIVLGRQLYTQALQLNPQHRPSQHNFLLGMQYDHAIDIWEILKRHCGWGKSVVTSNTPCPAHTNSSSPDKILRIGFVSADMGQHPVGYFLQQLFAHHNPKALSLFCYSTRASEDDISRTLKRHAHVWRNCCQMSDGELTAQISSDAIDILIDLAGHTSKNRLYVFAAKPAPVQCSWAGYVGTTGLPTMDYIISDRWQTPDGFEEYSVETPLRLDDGYITYTPPEYMPEVGPLPALKNGYVTFGCFNNISKINDAVISLWGKLLHKKPNAKLLMITHALKDELLNKKFRERFIAAGASPEQLLFEESIPHADLLDAYNRVDIGLDPFPYSGGLTTCESVYMGVPVITMPGRRFCSRHSASHLSNVGLDDWVVANREEYVALALRWADNLSELAGLRSIVRERVQTSPLCDGKRFTKSFEKAMRCIWKAWCRKPKTHQKEN